MKNQIQFSWTGRLHPMQGEISFVVREHVETKCLFITIYEPPVGKGVVLDINRNGRTVFTDQTKRPQPNARHTLINLEEPLIFERGDVLTVDIDQVGSVISGENMTIKFYPEHQEFMVEQT